MEQIKFRDYKEKIIDALKARGFTFFDPQTKQGDHLLIDQFVIQPIHDEVTGNVVIGGPTLPMVVIINVRTSELRFFALKGLIEVPLK